MQRVMVIGSPGAGKSTLSGKLAAVTGLPLFHLDAEYWLPGWTEREPREWQDKLADIVAGKRWIIDGNYGRTIAARRARSGMELTAMSLDSMVEARIRGAVPRATPSSV